MKVEKQSLSILFWMQVVEKEKQGTGTREDTSGHWVPQTLEEQITAAHTFSPTWQGIRVS